MNWIKVLFIHILMFGLFYYYFLFPLKNTLSHTIIAEKRLSQELWKKQKSYINKPSASKIYLTTLRKELFIAHFINNLKTHGFLIEEVYPLQIKKHGSLIKLTYRLTFSGNIFQLKKWIDQLSEDAWLIHIDEMVVKHIKKFSIQMVMKITVFNVHAKAMNVFAKNFYAFQWIGYTEKNRNIKGLIRLENGDVLEVDDGFIHKNLKILKITKEQMLVQMNNHVSIIKYGHTFSQSF